MAWIWAALMPHPPIVVPEVGRGREVEAALTLEGFFELEKRLAGLPQKGWPEVLIVLSPHQPYVPGHLFLNTAPKISGNLGRFGAAGISFSLTCPASLADLAAHLSGEGLAVVSGDQENLTPDHGSQVPLYFLRKIWGKLPPTILINPVGLSPEEALRLGQALASFGASNSQTWALLASGDLSHRLTPGAPAGYCPLGQDFDKAVMTALKEGHAEKVMATWQGPRLAEVGECGYRSALALMGLANGPVDILAYEGPFGVGYGQALWVPSSHSLPSSYEKECS